MKVKREAKAHPSKLLAFESLNIINYIIPRYNKRVREGILFIIVAEVRGGEFILIY